MSSAFGVASSVVIMQAVHEAANACGLDNQHALAPRWWRLAHDRLTLTVTHAVDYLQEQGYQHTGDVRRLVVSDALGDVRRMLRDGGVPEDVAGRVCALLDQVGRQG